MPHRLKYTRRTKALHPTKASTRFGDWEMDTIVDSFGHVILTLTERSTNFILMQKLHHGRKAMPTAQTVAGFFILP